MSTAAIQVPLRREPPAPSSPSLARLVLGLFPFQVALRAAEAGLPIVLALWFGRSHGTDLLNLVWAFFTLAGGVVFSLFRDSALVPVLEEVRARRPADLPRVRGSVLAHSLVGASGLAALAGVGMLLWLRRLPVVPDARLALALVIPFSVGLVVITARSFLEAALQAEGWFRAPSVAAALGTAGVLGGLAVGRHALGVAAVPPALLLGDLVAVAVLAVIARRRAGLRIELSFDRPEPARRFGRRALSEVAGRAVTRVNPVVDQMMAAAVGVAGGGTLLRLSQDVGLAPSSLLQATLLSVLLARLSRDGAAGRFARHRATVGSTIAWASAALAALCLLMFFLRVPLLRLLFLHGQMDAAGVARMAELLPYHLVGVVPFGALLMLVRAHVSLGGSRMMLGMGLLNCTLNVGLNFALRPVLGLEGIALSTSLVSTVVAVVLAVRLRRTYAELR